MNGPLPERARRSTAVRGSHDLADNRCSRRLLSRPCQDAPTHTAGLRREQSAASDCAPQTPTSRGRIVRLTANGGKRTSDVFPAELIPSNHSASQSEGSRTLRSLVAGPSRNHLDKAQVRDEQLLTVGRTAVLEPDTVVFSVAEPSSGTRASGEQGRRQASRGRHAVAPPPYLERRGARFVVFSGIGGAVFFIGLGLQAVLTGRWHVLPVVSYLIQAVVSVEMSFLLNRWLTWRDRGIPFWLSFARFNVQKAVTIALNLALYVALLRLGMNYLVANVVLTAVFTVVNYVAGDRLVFIPSKTRRVEPVTPAAPTLARKRRRPPVSAVIPCRNNEHTIGAAVLSLLDQDYPGLREIVLIGSPGDSTWKGLAGISHPRLTTRELETPPGVRDANFKRDAAVKMTSGDLIALVDSDIVLPSDWMSRAVGALEDSGASCAAGGMRSFHDSFWGRYTDSTWIGAKTPRIAESYTVTSADFGARGRKPPILANVLFTRELYNSCPIDPMWSHGSYEDYEWFWRVTKAGYGIRVCRDLFGWHHHRRGLRPLAKEYRRSSRGCAYFIRAHRDSPLAKRRLRQALILPIVAIAAAVAAVAAAAEGYAAALAGLLFGCAAVLAVHQVVRSRNLESIAYPAIGLALGLVFTTGLVMNLIRSGFDTAADSVIPSASSKPQAKQPASPPRWRFWPIAVICAVQAALSLALVWSNTAYIDEADYLWVGRLEIAHWLHGTSWPSLYAYRTLPGSPVLYPPLGALANNIGGLARREDPFAGLYAHCNSPALSRGLEADRPHRSSVRRCPLGVQRTGDATGIRYRRPAVGPSDGAVSLADCAGRLSVPPRGARGRGGSYPCPGQHSGVFRSLYRSGSNRVRIPRLANPHVGQPVMVLYRVASWGVGTVHRPADDCFAFIARVLLHRVRAGYRPLSKYFIDTQ